MKVYDLRIKSCTTITISGPSQSGKTTLVEDLVKERDSIFTEPISKVFWCCSFIPNNRIDGVTYNSGLPADILDLIHPHSLLIIDDLMSELKNSHLLTTLITKAVHHVPITLIYITQNIFHKSSDGKTRRLNTNYLFLFKNPQDKTQIDYIGRQMYPNDKLFLSLAYEDATKHPYSYLLIDSNQSTPDEIRVRTNITRGKVMHVYIPHSINVSI